MNTEDILKFENNDGNEVHLVRDRLFWQAWEHSAFLFSKYFRKYQPHHKFIQKVAKDLVYLGFPKNVLSDLQLTSKQKGFVYEVIDDDHIVIRNVPTSDEWTTLFSEVGGEANAGTALKATTVWNEGAGTDTYGFGVIPCGAYWGWGESGGGDFDGIGYNTTFWTALGDTATSTAVSVRFSSDTGAARLDGYSSVFGFSLRLIKDTPAIGKDGEKGLVPKPTESDASKVLSGAGTWVPLPTTDNFLSPTSTNAVQNKVIYDAIGNVEALLAAL